MGQVRGHDGVHHLRQRPQRRWPHHHLLHPLRQRRMCSRGSVIPLFIDRIRKGEPLTVTDPNMTRFLMNLDEAVDLVQFAFEHANPGDLFIQKAPASTIGDLAEAVQGGLRPRGHPGHRHPPRREAVRDPHDREEGLRAEDMGGYYRGLSDSRDLNYDKFVVDGEG